MVMLTYRIPESICHIAVQGEYDECGGASRRRRQAHSIF